MSRAASTTETLNLEASSVRSDKALPGLVMIVSCGRASSWPVRPTADVVEIGRMPEDGFCVLEDKGLSRRHARVTFERGGVRVIDLQSRNGTFVDGVRVQDKTFSPWPRVLRVGQSIFRFTEDLRPFLKGGVEVTPDEVMGPVLREVRAQIARSARAGDTVLITGPSGVGKELAARAFHQAGRHPQGPFIAVNCAAIPHGLAERLLFGAVKGTYSGADASVDGYLQAADGGTLFLDEIAELDPLVQPKLLRVLEQREVLALGAVKAKKVDLQICAATLTDLRARVCQGGFREDLFHRIARPEIQVPALVQRLEELPWLVQAELAALDPSLTFGVQLIEACALLPWPGNIRELRSEIRMAGRRALEAGVTLVSVEHLAVRAGRGALLSEEETNPPRQTPPEEVEAVLLREGGNVTRAAKVLGMHRNQLRRWLAASGVDPKVFRQTESRPRSDS